MTFTPDTITLSRKDRSMINSNTTAADLAKGNAIRAALAARDAMPGRIEALEAENAQLREMMRRLVARLAEGMSLDQYVAIIEAAIASVSGDQPK